MRCDLYFQSKVTSLAAEGSLLSRKDENKRVREVSQASNGELTCTAGAGS